MSYALPKGGQLWLLNAQIPPYKPAGPLSNHDPKRTRKLLLHRREIDRLQEQQQKAGYSLIPLSLYFKDGIVKVELGVVQGEDGRRQARHHRGARGEAGDGSGAPPGPRMNGKVVLITGGTSGIGRITARELKRAGATVVVVGRDPAKLEAIKREIGADTIRADLQLVAEARRAAEEFRRRYARLHVLVNNAGAVFGDRRVTREGLRAHVRAQSPRVLHAHSRAARRAARERAGAGGERLLRGVARWATRLLRSADGAPVSSASGSTATPS